MEAMDKLESYLNDLATRKSKIPSRDSGEKPNFSAVAAKSGVSYSYLLTQPFKQRINLAVQEIGLAPAQDLQEARLTHEFEKNCEHLSSYLKWLKDNGLKLPEYPNRRGEIFFRQVEIESGLKPSTLQSKRVEANTTNKARLRQIVEIAAPSIGVETRVLPQSLSQIKSPITHEQLLIKGTEERKCELHNKPGCSQQLYNTRSALRRFISVLNLEITSPVESEFVLDFERSVERVSGTIKSKGTQKKFQTEIRWWHDFHQRLIKEQSIPEDFQHALTYLIDRSGLPFSLLAKIIDCSGNSLNKWRQGLITPAASSYPVLSRIESLFKLPAGTLINKVSRTSSNRRFRPSQCPEFLRQDQSLYRKVNRYLPDNFCELSLAGQKELVKSILADILHNTDPWTLNLIELVKFPYKLKEWPQRLERDFNELAAFKMEERPPLGMRRNGRWRPTTKEKIRKDLNFLFGALRLPSDAADERARGLDVPEEHLSLAMLVCPLLLDWYIRFRCEKRTQYTRYVVVLLGYILGMLRPGTGWIRQNPQLASHLQPISLSTMELVPQELIVRAQLDWDGVCDDARQYYKNLIKELTPFIRIARDPFHPIAGIVEMDKPLDGLKILLNSMKNNLPNKQTAPRLYHCAIRNCVMVQLITMTGFRRTTISKLTYTGDVDGHLFWQNGAYRLEVPRALFKEENSPFFGPKHAQKDYTMELPNVFGCNKLFNEYLKISRPWLLSHYHPDCSEQPLLVTAVRDKSAWVSPVLVSSIYKEATTKHLAENRWRGSGIPHVKPHGPHSARHIRGTDSVKKTGSTQFAGDVNHNSKEMAEKHYTRFIPKDRNRRVNEVLFSDEKDVDDDVN